MRNFVFLLASVALMLGLSSHAQAQRGFHNFDTEKDIHIQYRWRASNIFERHANAALVLRMTNEAEHPVEVQFNVAFYRDKQLMFRSPGDTICLRAGQSLRGAPAGLRYMAEGISLDMVQSDWFSWDIPNMEVTAVESCN